MKYQHLLKLLLPKFKRGKIKETIIIPYDLQNNRNFSITKSIQHHFELNVFNSDDIGFFELSSIFPEWASIKNKVVNKFFLNKLSSFEHSKAKSWNQFFTTIYDFGRYVYQGKRWSFQQSINHVLFENNNKILELSYFSWNNRFHWHNNGSSHHMACAYYHNRNQNLNYYFDSGSNISPNIREIKVKEVYLNKGKIHETLENYEIFLAPVQLIININNLFDWDKSLKIRENGLFLEDSFSTELKILIFHKETFTNLIKEILKNEFYAQYFFNYKNIIIEYL